MPKKIVNHSEGYSYEIDVVTGFTKPISKKATGAKPGKKPGPKPGSKKTSKK